MSHTHQQSNLNSFQIEATSGNIAIDLSMEDECIKNLETDVNKVGNVNTPRRCSVQPTTSHPLQEITETIVNEKPNVVKPEMKLNLSNSNEYLQLIFSPSPLNENTENARELGRGKNNTQNMKNDIFNMVDTENNLFIDIEKEDVSTNTENVVISFGGNRDEKLRHFEIKSSLETSRHNSDSSNLDEDDNVNDFIQLTKEVASRKRNKQRLLSTTSVDSFSETLKDYVIPSDIDVDTGAQDTLKNALEEIEEGKY